MLRQYSSYEVWNLGYINRQNKNYIFSIFRSNFADDYVPKDLFNAEGTPFDLSTSTKFPKGFDLYKEPYEGYTHAPR